MTMTIPDAAELVQEGGALLRSGHRARARALLIQAVRVAPRSEQAWLLLAGAVTDPEQRRDCLERVLQLNPDHDLALRALATMPTRVVETSPAEAPAESAAGSGPVAVALPTDAPERPDTPPVVETPPAGVATPAGSAAGGWPVAMALPTDAPAREPGAGRPEARDAGPPAQPMAGGLLQRLKMPGDAAPVGGATPSVMSLRAVVGVAGSAAGTGAAADELPQPTGLALPVGPLPEGATAPAPARATGGRRLWTLALAAGVVLMLVGLALIGVVLLRG